MGKKRKELLCDLPTDSTGNWCYVLQTAYSKIKENQMIYYVQSYYRLLNCSKLFKIEFCRNYFVSISVSELFSQLFVKNLIVINVTHVYYCI